MINPKEKKEEQAYKEILDVLKKYREICVYDVNEMESLAKKHLFGIELKEKYGFNVEPRNIKSLDWNRFSDYMSLGLWGEKYNRKISWSDDGKQPENELLLELSFSTGACIFGDDYPTELFQRFWQELKTYNPKYSDTTNNNLYFSLENGAKLFNEFKDILEKYYEINKIDAKERKIKKLQKELAGLTPNDQ